MFAFSYLFYLSAPSVEEPIGIIVPGRKAVSAVFFLSSA
jgi:hypothetical protein